MTAAAFKRSIRDLQVWCSSCMVAFSGSDPIGILIGAKRTSGTLIHRIAVHPDHCRQGHGRHLLTSLSSKLAILGPPRLIAEVPETLVPAYGLFSACGYVEEATLTDYVLQQSARDEPAIAGSFAIPVTVDDLEANGLLDDAASHVCWERSGETVRARKDDLTGLAVASDERIEAYVLHAGGGEILSLRPLIEDGGARLRLLLAHLRAQAEGVFRLSKVHPAEMPGGLLESIGFRVTGRHRLYTATARSD
jgi:GNAT acetyltransferase-like protein